LIVVYGWVYLGAVYQKWKVVLKRRKISDLFVKAEWVRRRERE
jgi:hypothetical protein